MVGVELRVTAVRSRPVQIQAVKAVDLLRRCTAVHLHGGLLITIVASNIKCADRRAWHLSDRGPGIPAARNVLQQILVKTSSMSDCFVSRLPVRLPPSRLA